MKFKELAAKIKFKSTPSLFFGPQELDKEKGDYPFIIQFFDDDIPQKTKNKKEYWSMTIDLITDNRTDTTTNPISPGRYRFDLTEENMSKLNKLECSGVDIFAAPMEFIHRRGYKGKHIFSFYDFRPTTSNKSVTKIPAAAEVAVKKPSPTDDDFDFNFDE